MKKLTLLLALFSVFSLNVDAQKSVPNGPQGSVVPGELIVMFHGGLDAAAFCEKYKSVSGFKSGLTPVKSDLVDAPYVKEFPLVIECEMIHNVEVGLHTLFVGEIKDVKADESMLNEDGVPGIERVSPILFAPEIRSYHSIGKTLGKAFSIGKEIQQ